MLVSVRKRDDQAYKSASSFSSAATLRLAMTMQSLDAIGVVGVLRRWWGTKEEILERVGEIR